MVEKVISNWKKAQDAGVYLPCPRCGKICMDEESATRNALSRRADVYICDKCGKEESDEDMSEKKEAAMSLNEWFAVREVFGVVSVEKDDAGRYIIPAKRTVVLSEEDIDDIMCGAIEGGISYWASKAEVVEDEYLGEFASEQISRGGSLRIYDREDGETYLLTLEKLLKGFSLAVSLGYDDGWIDIPENTVDMCCIDAQGCDVIVQLALFGDVIYG